MQHISSLQKVVALFLKQSSKRDAHVSFDIGLTNDVVGDFVDQAYGQALQHYCRIGLSN